MYEKTDIISKRGEYIEATPFRDSAEDEFPWTFVLLALTLLFAGLGLYVGVIGPWIIIN